MLDTDSISLHLTSCSDPSSVPMIPGKIITWQGNTFKSKIRIIGDRVHLLTLMTLSVMKIPAIYTIYYIETSVYCISK